MTWFIDRMQLFLICCNSKSFIPIINMMREQDDCLLIIYYIYLLTLVLVMPQEGSEPPPASSLSLPRVRPSPITNGTNKHSSATGSSSSSTSSSHSKTQRSASTYHRQRRHSDFCESLFRPRSFPFQTNSTQDAVRTERVDGLLHTWLNLQNIPYTSLCLCALLSSTTKAGPPCPSCTPNGARPARATGSCVRAACRPVRPVAA